MASFMVLEKLSNADLTSPNSHVLSLEPFSPILFLLRPEIKHGKASDFNLCRLLKTGSLLKDRRARQRAGGAGRKEAKSSRAGGQLTTGLARAELALEEARELELRWPLYSEGCPHGRHRTRRQKQRNRVSKEARRMEAKQKCTSVSPTG